MEGKAKIAEKIDATKLTESAMRDFNHELERYDETFREIEEKASRLFNISDVDEEVHRPNNTDPATFIEELSNNLYRFRRINDQLSKLNIILNKLI